MSKILKEWIGKEVKVWFGRGEEEYCHGTLKGMDDEFIKIESMQVDKLDNTRWRNVMIISKNAVITILPSHKDDYWHAKDKKGIGPMDLK